MSEEAQAGRSPAQARLSLALKALMEAGLAGRQGKEEMTRVQGPDLLRGGQPGPQPVALGSSTVSTRPLQALPLQGGAEWVPCRSGDI